MEKLFENKAKRYMTKAIAEEISMELVSILWILIDTLVEQNLTLDYLQVFKLSESDGKQVILHKQEVPKMKGKHIRIIQESAALTTIIWCIDNGESQVMLFPQDY
ncbi:DUF960 family protein [Planococcus kocurii]|uniref:DUF960 family protein n=1 Tax=Planococcus kocurii TaxID=1374 RepID=UPI003D07ECC9